MNDAEWYIPDSLNGWDSKRIEEFFLNIGGEFDFEKPILILYGIAPEIVKLADDIGESLPLKLRSRVALYANVRMRCEIYIIEKLTRVAINIAGRSEFFTGEPYPVEAFRKDFLAEMKGSEDTPWYAPAGTNRGRTTAPAPKTVYRLDTQAEREYEMIRVGGPPYLECSSKGDKRFSAFYARVNGRSIEDQYQAAKVFKDGSTGLSWREAKGKKAVNQEEVAELYEALWRQYIDENPDLLEVLIDANGLSDMFGQRGHVCQATTLWKMRCEAMKGRA